ncbi:threonine/serine exporter family protein [Mariniluteicoccus endophyticus]
MTTDRAEDVHVRRRRLLAYLGASMLAGGQPAHEVSDDLREVARFLGYPDLQVSPLPTNITLSLSSGEAATHENVRSSMSLDKLTEVHRIRRRLISGELSEDDAITELSLLRTRPRRYGDWSDLVGFVTVPAGIAAIMQPGWVNILAAALCGLVVMVMTRLASRRPLLKTLLPSTAAFIVGLIIFAAAQHGLLLGPLRTLLPPLAILLPGALLVTGMAELAAGAMVAGASRLVFGAVQLLLFTLGVVTAGLVLDVPPEQYANFRVTSPGWWLAPLGLLSISIGIMLMESVSPRLWPWVVAVLAATFAVQVAGQVYADSPALGAFVGAAVASCGAALAQHMRPELPRMVVFLPSFWLLVPGTLGLMSVSQLGVDPGMAISTTIGVAAVICAIALGLLVGSAVARGVVRAGKRARRVRRPRA